MEYISLAISILALLGSFWSVMAAIKYSRITVIHSLHQLMLQKANDCNNLFQKTQVIDFTKSYQPVSAYDYIPTISEVIISIQLLDNSLTKYSQTKERDFFLKQFWVQLNTSVRWYFKNVQYSGYPETAQNQILDIQRIFGHLFEVY